MRGELRAVLFRLCAASTPLPAYTSEKSESKRVHHCGIVCFCLKARPSSPRKITSRKQFSTQNAKTRRSGTQKTRREEEAQQKQRGSRRGIGQKSAMAARARAHGKLKASFAIPKLI